MCNLYLFVLRHGFFVWLCFCQRVPYLEREYNTIADILYVNDKNQSVCYHVTYAFQSESTLYSCLNVKELLAGNRRIIWSLAKLAI